MQLSSEQISKLTNLVRDCGTTAMGYYYKQPKPDKKEKDHTVVTEADIAVHKQLVEGLADITPDITVVSEEDKKSHKSKAKTYWLIDPIDGTKGFVNKDDTFTISVGLISDKYPEFGILYAPAKREMFWGGTEYGAFKKDGFKPQTTIAARTSRRDVVAIIRTKPEDKTYELLQKIGVSEKLKLDASLKFGRIAEGKAQIYVRYTPQHLWDVAAGQAIAEGAGAVMINPENSERFSYDLKKGTKITPLVCHSLGGLVETALNPPPPEEEEDK